MQGSNFGKKSTRPQGLLLRIFTGPEDFLQDQNFIGKKKSFYDRTAGLFHPLGGFFFAVKPNQ